MEKREREREREEGGYRRKILDVYPGQMEEKYGRKQREERDLLKVRDDEEQRNVKVIA